MAGQVGADYWRERRDRAGAGEAAGGGRRESGADGAARGPFAKTGCRSVVAARHQSRSFRRGPDAPEAPGEIYAFTAGKKIEVELLINNAGFGAYGYMHEIPWQKMLEMIQVNCAAVVHLTRLYLPAMVQRKHGDVMIVASLAGFQPLPFSSVTARPRLSI